MQLTTYPITLHLRQPFATAGSRTEQSESLVVQLEHEGEYGLGEVKCTADSCGGQDQPISAFSQNVSEWLGNSPFELEDTLARVHSSFGGASCLLAGVDTALHDLCGRLLGIPAYRFLGLNPGKTPYTSFTIGIDLLPTMIEKTRAARNCPILKLKAGFPGDLEMIEAVRCETDATLRVDANGGWSGVREATARINGMAEYGVEFVEQPLRRGTPQGLSRIRDQVDIPVIADEDVRTSADIPSLIGCVDGINIKLMECGGMREALRMIHVARCFDMQVMLGCMVESSLSLTAAAHLTPLTDYADLDAHLLLQNDPFEGFTFEAGKIKLPDQPGLGIKHR